LTGEFYYKPNKRVSFGVAAGFLPVGITLGDTKVTSTARNQSGKVDIHISEMTSLEGRSRWHVLQGPFYLGLAGGWQRFAVGVNAKNKDNDYLGDAVLSRIYLTPNLGFNWVLDSGLSLGFELGAQIPVGAKLGLTANPEFRDSKNTVEEVRVEIDPYIYYVTPYINFIKVGYTF
jgi:hypothetical protein